MKKLSVPENINLEWELLPGIGVLELKRLCLFAAPGIIVMVSVILLMGQPWPRLISMICGGVYLVCCYAFVVKTEGIGSMYDFFARKLHFRKTQQKFYYKQGEEALRYAETERRCS